MKNKIKVLIIDTSWQRLKSARMKNIPNCYGQVLSEVTDEQIDMSEIGSILAASDNDAYNVLVCTHFAHKLGRNQVFQLPMLDSGEEDIRGELHPSLSGESIFLENFTYENIIDQHYRGYQFQATLFTEVFTPEQHQLESAEEAYPVMVVHASSKISFYTKTNAPKLEAGDLLISYTPIRGKEKKQDA